MRSSRAPVISRDGSAVFFVNGGDHPDGGIPEDTNDVDDIYAVDTRTLDIEVVSRGTDEDNTEGAGSKVSVSADGRYVAFTRGLNIYRRDRINDTTELVSVLLDGTKLESGFGWAASNPQISGDGNVIAFLSNATELVEDDDDSVWFDIFVRDMTTKQTQLVTKKDDGSHVDDFFDGTLVMRLSNDARYLFYGTHLKMSNEDEDSSESDNDSSVQDIYVKDRLTNTHHVVTTGIDNGWVRLIDISPDARYILFAAQSESATTYCDTCGSDGSNLIIADLNLGTFERAEGRGKAVEGDPVDTWMSADTRHIVFSTKTYRYCDYVEWLQWAPTSTDGYPIANGFAYDRNSGVFSHVTASDNGVPGIIPNYDSTGGVSMADYIESAINEDGSMIVFSTIMHGIVDDIGLPCIAPPRQIYLRTCNNRSD